MSQTIDEDQNPICFYFIVDRSYSMTTDNRVELAKDAMKLFLQSLPPKCKYHIVSFGSDFEYLNKSKG